MRGRQREATSTYKRVWSRDSLNAFEKEESAGRLSNIQGKDGNPSWKGSFPNVLVASLASFLFGYHLGVVNETLESMSLDLGFSGSTLAEGLVVSTCLGGAFVGSLFSGWIADGVGCRRAFQLCALPMIIGASVSATTQELAGMLLGRFLVGTGMGLGPAVAALYVAEVSPAFIRGTYGSSTQIASCLGILGSLFIGIPSKEIVGWVMIKSSVFIAVVFIGSALFALQQFSGINAVFYFSSIVFRNAGVASDVGNTCIGVANLLGSIIAMILVDKLGRKVLLLWSFSGMVLALSFQIIAASSFIKWSGTLYLSIGGMLLFVFTFSLGAGPVPGLLLSEILPNRIRAKAMALCMSVHWVVNFFVGLLFLRLLEQLGAQLLYTIFATFCVLAVAFVKKNVVETKGKSLQEIEIALLPA